MPGSGVSSECVAIKPRSQGTSTLSRVTCALLSGKPKSVKEAGGGSVSHIASMAAIFIF